MASDESGERSRHRRLEGHAQNLLLEHLCSARSHDQIHQAFERLSIDNSRAGPSRSARSNDAPSRAFFTFMLSSKSNLITTRRFLRSATIKIYPTKCYLKPFKRQELMMETSTLIAVIKLTMPQNIQLSIDSDEVTLMRFSEIQPHIPNANRLRLEWSAPIRTHNKFAIMVQTMAPNLNELKCSINTLVYLSFITNGPILRLDYLKVFYTSNDEARLPMILTRNIIKKLYLSNVSGDDLILRNRFDTTLPGFQSLEKLGITTFSVGVTLELLDFIRRFRKRAPKMDCVELSSTEIFRHSNSGRELVEWFDDILECFTGINDASNPMFRSLIVNIDVIKTLHGPETVVEWINQFRETEHFRAATFNESATIGDDFGNMEIVNGCVVLKLKFVAMSALSGSFVENTNRRRR